MRASHAVAGATALALMMSFSGVTLAANSNDQGKTTGMADHSNVKPNAAVDRSAAGGAPGMAGQKGSKDGPAQTPQSNSNSDSNSNSK